MSLHDFGLLTIWTVIHSQAANYLSDITNVGIRIDHQSPWSQVKLVQSACIDLHATLQTQRVRPKSGFERTRSYFESNLFSDTALRELQQDDGNSSKADDSNVLYGDLEVAGESFFVATNRQFLLTGSCTALSGKSLRKILLDDGEFGDPYFYIIKSQFF